MALSSSSKTEMAAVEQGRDELSSPALDVLEAGRAEAALLASERRARVLFEGIDDAVFVHDLQGRILDANPAATRLLGYSRAEMLGLTTSEIDEPEFAAGYASRLAAQLDDGHLACEGRHRTKDGRVIPVEIRTSSIQLDDQPAVLAVIRDISERAALEEARKALVEAQAETNAVLKRSEAWYRQFTEGSLDGVVAADGEGNVSRFNSAAEQMFGLTASEVIGRPLSVLMPSVGSRCSKLYFHEYLRGVVGKTIETHGVRKDGEEFPMELSCSSVESEGERQLVVSIRDQTERQRMRAMLMQSEKLASIGLLSAGVAHEINNPLAYVANNLAVLERDHASMLELVSLYEAARPAIEANDPEALSRIDDFAADFDWTYVRDNLPRMLKRTREGVQRVAAIVAGMRGLARTGPTRMETARVVDLIGGAVELVRNRLRRGNIALEIACEGSPTLVCVPPQISQVVLNLLLNAAQAVEGAGDDKRDGGGGTVKLSTWVEGKMLVLAIGDNGPGIEPDHMPRIFDPFFTTKSVGEGTGLGLSICHGIVTGHGGRIEVASKPGAGTTFRVYLPLTHESGERVRTSTDPLEAPQA